MVNFFSLWQRGKKSAATTPEPIGLADIVAATSRIRPILPVTPLTHSPHLSETLGREVYFKWDNKLKTGSFKERGAVNFLLGLTEEQKKQGVCAASAGNHALALSYYSAKFKVRCKIIMPTAAPLVKVQSTRATGAEVILHGEKFDDAYEFAQELARKENLVFVPAFDHPQIIAGQGSAAVEILEQLPDVEAIIVPVGGGGLISGIATYLKEKKPDIFILGAQSEWATGAVSPPTSNQSSAVRPVTIADGIAVKKVSPLTSQIIEAKVDKLVALNENDIARAIIRFIEIERSVVEGAAAVALAALLGNHLPPERKKVVVMVSGSNIDVNLVSRLIERDMAESGRLLRIKVSLPDRPGALHRVSGIIAEFGANILEVFHDRSFSALPGNVDISFVLEVRDLAHSESVVRGLEAQGIPARMAG